MSSSWAPAGSQDQTWRSAAEHSRNSSEKRCAGDGRDYSWEEFHKWYGNRAAAMWEEAYETQSGATEHIHPNTTSASASTEQAPPSAPPSALQSGAAPTALQSGATEHTTTTGTVAVAVIKSGSLCCACNAVSSV